MNGTFDRCLSIIRRSKIQYEVRTTVYPPLVDLDSLVDIYKDIREVDSWYLQPYKMLNDSINEVLSLEVINRFLQNLKGNRLFDKSDSCRKIDNLDFVQNRVCVL